MNSRYDDQIAIFGRDFQENIVRQKTFVVGAGALGCELLKAFALMGLGCSINGKVSVTDNDHIELSNLNRQFLFRNKHIGKSKAKVACKEAQRINSELSTKAYESLVCPDTEDIFDDKFWERQDYIVNAVDNRAARLYIDSKCVWYKKALLDSGTLGTKANTQLVIPHLTECYADSKDPEEESIPMCTLRNFPNQIEHCIEWGRHRFGELFTEKPNNLRSFLTDREAYLSKLQKDNTDLTIVKELKSIKQLLELKDFEDCVGFAKQKFYEDHELQISKLIELFPETHKDSEGNPFWSGPKRFPHPIEFDPEDELHVDYIVAASNLIAECLGIERNEDRDEIEQMAAEAEVDEEIEADEIQLDEEEEKAGKTKAKKSGMQAEQLREERNELIKEVMDMDAEEDDVHPAEFEKDDSTNYHIEFIHAAANLRARNYKLEECDKFKSKMIAGKIVPAIATTTATIVGAVLIELVKVIQGFKELSDYRNTYLNLAISLFVQNEPGEPKKNKDVEMDPIMLLPVKAIPPNWTIWDTIELKGPLTVSGFLKEFQKKYKVNINMITSGERAIYNSYIKKDAMKQRLDQKIEDIEHSINEKATKSKNKYIILGVGGTTESDGTEVSMPKIKYIFK